MVKGGALWLWEGVRQEKKYKKITEKGYYYGRPGLLLYTAYLELKAEGVKNLYWAEQGLTDVNAATTYLSAGAPADDNNLHPPMMGMTDIANWILKCMKDNNVGVEVKADLPLVD